jgi:hypothetical protein
MEDLALPLTIGLEEEGEYHMLATTIVAAAKIIKDMPEHFSIR